jgi:prepilin-type N-terminal cleavage/methylation domain-containing protein
MRHPIRRRRSQRGFTFVEAIITVAIIGILVLIGMPTILGTLNRTRLTGACREIASLFQLARLEAIKMDTPVEINYEAGTRRFFAYVDANRDSVADPTERRLTATVNLPRKVGFKGPGDALEEGTEAIVGWDGPGGPVFRSDGSVDLAGAYRFSDSNANVIEVRIETPATGKVQLRKWNPDTTSWYAHLENGQRWSWY